MKCSECGSSYIKRYDLLKVKDPYVGEIAVEGVPYYECDSCRDVLYTEEMAQSIESKRKNRIEDLINQYPINSFLNAAEVASLLGITRQALHKNRRIKHGFIYQTKFCGSTVYLKKSVEQYKETGDGRFPLYQYKSSKIPKSKKGPLIKIN